MAIKHFRKGSSTFPCRVCGRLTRDTGAQSFGNRICPQCYELAGIENSISDGHVTEDEAYGEVVSLLTQIKAKGGSLAGWAPSFGAAVEEVSR